VALRWLFYVLRFCHALAVSKNEGMMANLSDMPIDEAGEARFRRGFIHGVQEVINAVEPHLTEEQSMRLGRWVSDELRPWQMSGGGVIEAPSAPDLAV
jgi:hypothetical protein